MERETSHLSSERACVLASRDHHVIKFIVRSLRERGIEYWHSEVMLPGEDARLKSKGARIDVRSDDLQIARDIAADIIARRARQKTIPSQHEVEESPPGSASMGMIDLPGA